MLSLSPAGQNVPRGHARGLFVAGRKGFMARRVNSPDHDVLELCLRKIVMPGRGNKLPLKLIRIIFAVDVEAALGLTPDHLIQELVSRCCRAKKSGRIGGLAPATLSSKNRDLPLISFVPSDHCRCVGMLSGSMDVKP